MANPITGDFDAVVQIAVRQLNGLLAALHQDDANENAPLKLLHSLRTRVGDPHRRFPDVGAFGDWVLEVQDAGPPRPEGPLRDQLIAAVPPGLAARLAAAFKDLDGLVFDPLPPEVVRGAASIQVSTIQVSAPEGSTSRIVIDANVRARYTPDSGTAVMPAPIHGDIRAAFDIGMATIAGRRRLTIRASAHDPDIVFDPAPGSGLSASDAARISTEVRKLLREGITAPPVDLPGSFPFSAFKAVGNGAHAAFALPLQLSDTPAPQGGIQNITQSLVSGSGFAFGVSREYVTSLIDVEAIKAAVQQQTFTKFRATYHLRFSSGPTLTFRAGFIEISGRVEAETSAWWAPNGFVSFKQRVTLVLDAAHQVIALVRQGDPAVDESWFVSHDRAVNLVNAQMAGALAANAPSVQQIFQDARATLQNALHSFERSAGAAYAAIEITPDGIIVRGNISTAARMAPVVEIADTDGGESFTAFKSWVPGGQIDRFTWSWTEYDSMDFTPWSGTSKSVTDDHTFVFAKPAGITEVSQVCLRVDGVRVLSDGSIAAAAGGQTCQVPEPTLELEAPSWWEPLLVPVWKPDLRDDRPVREAVAAHISVQTDRPPREPGLNTLVFFANWDAEDPFAALSRMLEPPRKGTSAPVLLVILPAGAFDATRRELDARMRSLAGRAAGRVQVAEDVGGGWTRAFGVRETPAAFLVDARGRFAWQSADSGPLEAHLVPTFGPRFRPLRLHVARGSRAPDFSFNDDRGVTGSLHRLLGQRVHLVFWQAWSDPSRAALRRLEAVGQKDRRSAVAIALHGGAPRDTFDDVRKELDVACAFVSDSEHQVARAFGVRCWPTTITIGPDGTVEDVKFG